MIEQLNAYQRESLAAWYLISRNSTAGYYPGEFSDRKPTMDTLYRLGIIEQPHHGSSTQWSAKVTPEGEEIAKQCRAIEEQGIVLYDPCGCEVDTSTGFRRVTVPCSEHKERPLSG